MTYKFEKSPLHFLIEQDLKEGLKIVKEEFDPDHNKTKLSPDDFNIWGAVYFGD